MTAKKAAKPASESPATEQPDTGAAKHTGGHEYPEKILIIGLDVLPGDALYDASLEDPDRLKGTPSRDSGIVQSILRHGVNLPVLVKKVGKVLLCADGRQRITACRVANEILKEQKSDFYYRVEYTVKNTSDGITVAVANEFRRIDSAVVKARKAERLVKQGHNTDAIIGAFSADGGEPISKMTLSNWKYLLKCKPEILARIEAGEITVSIGYALGRKPVEEQDAILASIEAKGGTLKGKAGLDNVRDGVTGEDEEEGEEGEDGEENDGQTLTTRTRSKKLTAGQIGALAAIFGPQEDEEYDDAYQELTGAIFAVIVGNDPTGKGLKAWPSVQKHFKKVLRSKTKASPGAAAE